MTKATKSVTDVIEIDTPACFSARPTRSGKGLFLKDSGKLFQDSMITNISWNI